MSNVIDFPQRAARRPYDIDWEAGTSVDAGHLTMIALAAGLLRRKPDHLAESLANLGDATDLLGYLSAAEAELYAAHRAVREIADRICGLAAPAA